MLVAGQASTGQAQIYSWHDSNGTLVLSDRPLSPDAVTFPVASSTSSIRTTKQPIAHLAKQYDRIIEQHAVREHVRSDLVRAVIQTESGFNPRAQSPKGAMGLMQIMPATATSLGVTDVFDPAENIRGGVTYLSQLLTRYRGDEVLALAAYNAGPEAVERYGNQVPPYPETQEYVVRVKTATKLASGASRSVIYKIVETVAGREIARYTNVKPQSGVFEVVRLDR